MHVGGRRFARERCASVGGLKDESSTETWRVGAIGEEDGGRGQRGCGTWTSSILERPFWMRWRKVARLIATGVHSDEETSWTAMLFGNGTLGLGKVNTYFESS